MSRARDIDLLSTYSVPIGGIIDYSGSSDHYPQIGKYAMAQTERQTLEIHLFYQVMELTGTTGGSHDAIVVSHEHTISHTHTMSHTHSTPDHTHSYRNNINPKCESTTPRTPISITAWIRYRPFLIS